MTVWQSMFDAGSCKIRVEYQGTIVWEGVLTSAPFPGNSSPTFVVAGSTYFANVTANRVSLSGDDTAASPYLFKLFVFPQYDVSALKTSAQNMQGYGVNGIGNPNVDGIASCDDPSQSLTVSFFTTPASPADANFLPHAAAVGTAYVAIELPSSPGG